MSRFNAHPVYDKRAQVLRKNTRVNGPVMIDGRQLEDVEEFNYLGTKVTATGDWSQEVIARISKANQAFSMLKPVWRATNLSVHSKMKIFKSNVLKVLLYGPEIEVFKTKCLRCIFKIYWPNTISHEELEWTLAEIKQTRHLRWR